VTDATLATRPVRTPFSRLEKALLVVIAYFLLLRFAYSFFAFPIGDEAYYWMWGRHPALSYFDHPPLQGWVQGLSYAIFGRSLFALRWMTVVALAVNLWLFHLFAKRVAGEGWRTFFLTSSAIYLASPLYGFFTALTLHDYLLVTLVLASGYFFTCYFTDVEAKGTARLRDLLLGAVFLGLATLTKYNGAFLGVAIAATVLIRPKLRHLLLDWRLWAAALVAIAIQAPVLIWNAQQGFASFLFQMGTRHGESGFSGFAGLNFMRMKLFAGEAMLMVSPFMVPIVLLFFWARQKNPFERVGKTIAIVAFWVSSLVCLYLSNFSWVIWWWNIVAFVMVFPFAARYANPILLWLHIGWGVIVSSILAFTYVVVPVQALMGQMPGMESERSFGWDQLTEEVLAAQQAQGAQFLLTNRFETASELAFALNDPDVVSLTEKREGYDDWVDWESLRGKDAIALLEERTDNESWKASFASTEELGVITTRRFGYPINVFRLYVGRGFTPPERPTTK
jgi:4-amino-4-deoxy-L-arabinose transferase-like glycosyltransferase